MLNNFFSTRNDNGADQGRGLGYPSPPHFLSEQNSDRSENYRGGVWGGVMVMKIYEKNLSLNCNI